MDTTPFRVTVNVPTGFYKITNQGVTFRETVPGDWHLPLSEARAVFEACLRSVEVLIEVEQSNMLPSSPAVMNSGVGAEGGRTGATRGRVDSDDGEFPPASRPPSDCSECPYHFNVCCWR